MHRFRAGVQLSCFTLLVAVAPAALANDPPPCRVVNNRASDVEFKLADKVAVYGFVRIYNADDTKMLHEMSRVTWSLKGAANNVYTLKAGDAYDIVIAPSETVNTENFKGIGLTLGFPDRAGKLKTINVKELIMEDSSTGKILDSVPSGKFQSLKNKLIDLLGKVGVDKSMINGIDAKSILKPFFKEDPKESAPGIKVDLSAYQRAKDGAVFIELN
jgi:hypothetical protein